MMYMKSDDELQKNFELAHQYLKKTFSKYPVPKEVIGCPCCVLEEMQEELKKGDTSLYFRKAMNTWGNEDDFKHYLPRIFEVIYLENKYHDDAWLMPGKIDRIKNLSIEEMQAIYIWFNAYVKYQYIPRFKEAIKITRSEVAAWLEGKIEKLDCYFPLDAADIDPNLISFLDPTLLEEFTGLLNIWPKDEIDFIAYASCITNYKLIRGDFGIFEAKIGPWFANNVKVMEELFFKTMDIRLQQLFSQALPPNYYQPGY